MPYSTGNNSRRGKNSGVSNATTDPVVLKVLSWNVAGLSEDSTDIFLSQVSMLTEWDVLLLQECFRKRDGVNSWCTRIIYSGEDCNVHQSS